MSTMNKSEDSCLRYYDINTRHRILGHCNYDDIRKLPNVVKGMRIKEKIGTVKFVSKENFLRAEIDNLTDVLHLPLN